MSSVISISLEPITLCGDLNKIIILGGFSELSALSISIEDGYNYTPDPKELENKWNIELESVKKMIQYTISLCPSNMINITLIRI